MATYQGSLSAQILDEYGIPGQTQVTITVPDTATVAQIATDVNNFLQDTQALSDGVVMTGRIVLEFPLSGADPTLATGDVEKGGLFNFNNLVDTFATGVLVPDLASAVLNASGLIDLTNADVQTWITWMTTAHTAITVVTKGLRALSALRDALISFRKHRKPLTRKTKEV